MGEANETYPKDLDPGNCRLKNERDVSKMSMQMITEVKSRSSISTAESDGCGCRAKPTANEVMRKIVAIEAVKERSDEIIASNTGTTAIAFVEKREDENIEKSSSSSSISSSPSISLSSSSITSSSTSSSSISSLHILTSITAASKSTISLMTEAFIPLKDTLENIVVSTRKEISRAKYSIDLSSIENDFVKYVTTQTANPRAEFLTDEKTTETNEACRPKVLKALPEIISSFPRKPITRVTSNIEETPSATMTIPLVTSWMTSPETILIELSLSTGAAQFKDWDLDASSVEGGSHAEICVKNHADQSKEFGAQENEKASDGTKLKTIKSKHRKIIASTTDLKNSFNKKVLKVGIKNKKVKNKVLNGTPILRGKSDKKKGKSGLRMW